MEESLKTNKSDVVAIVARSALGAVPVAGALLSELVTVIIPNQKIDRLSEFISILDAKLSHLEQSVLKRDCKNESFSDFIEEGLRHASRAVSRDRKEYIATLVANALSSKDIDYIESKYILRILDEINDIEIIWLRFYLVPTEGGDEEFRSKHSAILEHLFVNDNEKSLELRDRCALQENYKDHLNQLGLLRMTYKKDIRTKQTKYDSQTGGLMKKGHEITQLGRLFLRKIGLAN